VRRSPLQIIGQAFHTVPYQRFRTATTLKAAAKGVVNLPISSLTRMPVPSGELVRTAPAWFA
jgi:hypothetical protein